jgi:hypothetical protein
VKRGHWFKIKNIRECEVDIEELPAFMSITGSNELSLSLVLIAF